MPNTAYIRGVLPNLSLRSILQKSTEVSFARPEQLSPLPPTIHITFNIPRNGCSMKEGEGRRLVRRRLRQGAAGGAGDLRQLAARFCQPEWGEGLTATCFHCYFLACPSSHCEVHSKNVLACWRQSGCKRREKTVAIISRWILDLLSEASLFSILREEGQLGKGHCLAPHLLKKPIKV